MEPQCLHIQEEVPIQVKDLIKFTSVQMAHLIVSNTMGTGIMLHVIHKEFIPRHDNEGPRDWHTSNSGTLKDFIDL